MRENNCRVCGLFIQDKPWGENGKTPTYEICPCCGVEFGVEDYTKESTKEYREKWIESGCQWFDKKEKPENWNLSLQMENIPDYYL
ncbi:MAG: hypothetical protein LUF85_15295 [Bacteroides sp.]|nr:hypothetical protein [Bacteroides sp.]